MRITISVTTLDGPSKMPGVVGHAEIKIEEADLDRPIEQITEAYLKPAFVAALERFRFTTALP